MAVEVEPVATGSILPNSMGRVKAVSMTAPVMSRISTPKVQSPVSGGVNQIDSSVGILFPAVTAKVIESRRVLLRNASKVTSMISKNAFEVTSSSISTLSSRLSPSRSNGVIPMTSTSAGSVMIPACTTISVAGYEPVVIPQLAKL